MLPAIDWIVLKRGHFSRYVGAMVLNCVSVCSVSSSLVAKSPAHSFCGWLSSKDEHPTPSKDLLPFSFQLQQYISPNQPNTFCVHTGHPLPKMVQSCPGCKVLSYPRQLVVLPEVNLLQEWVGQKGPHPKHWVGAAAAAGDVEWSPNFIVQFLLDRFKIMLFLSLLYQLVHGWVCGYFIQRALLSFGGE